MKNTKIIITTNNNHYLVSPYKKQVLYLPDILVQIISLKENLLNVAKNDIYSIKATKSEIDYYLNKYYFLKKNVFFRGVVEKGILLETNTIEENIKKVKQINFEVTESCNLKCKYCIYEDFYSFGKEKRIKKADIHIAKRFIDYRMGNKEKYPYLITFSFYGGEALTNFKYIKEFVEYVKNKYPKQQFRYIMTTNTTLLDKHIDFLYENKFNLLISLDGNEKHNQFRIYKNGKATYNKILKNILLLKSNYPEYFEHFVEFNAVLHIQDEAEVVNYFIKTFNKKPRISFLQPSFVKSEKLQEFKEIFKYSEQNDEKESDKNINSFFKYYGNYFTLLNNFIKIENKHLEQSLFPNSGITCSPFKPKIFITVDNYILPCEKVPITNAFGKMFLNNGVIKFDFKDMTSKYNSSIKKMQNTCEECVNTECPVCLHSENINNKSDCKFFISEKSSELEIIKNISFIERNKAMIQGYKN